MPSEWSLRITPIYKNECKYYELLTSCDINVSKTPEFFQYLTEILSSSKVNYNNYKIKKVNHLSTTKIATLNVRLLTSESIFLLKIKKTWQQTKLSTSKKILENRRHVIKHTSCSESVYWRSMHKWIDFQINIELKLSTRRNIECITNIVVQIFSECGRRTEIPN